MELFELEQAGFEALFEGGERGGGDILDIASNGYLERYPPLI